ncbi:WecB/TagA/CpsF family glycosyltransferase [Pseudaestuariivita atlantica]|uniref:Glycosyl transferase n=1 Tax=Pseudaestuariivita atlantica TaxID=1317121 RepID=A0A0L1JP46_9RHOB|nr:WecB/TagA/CpsF family glycosyltransferase [Pseudaestuariivita atlantica]KNG93540.1 glycosyl transferase [Pseudaestuariivita atlantica]
MQFTTGQGHVTINTPSKAALMATVEARLTAGEGFALATLNLDHLVKLNSDPAFQAAYDAQDIVVADGNPIVWMSRMAGQPVELVPGADLVVPLARQAARLGVPVALLGTTDEALADAAEALTALAPGLKVAARIAPPMGFDPMSPAADATYDSLAKSGARLCFLALGAPKQEMLAARGRSLTPQVGFVSIGAGLDFLAGTQTRAPAWVRRLALEWVWRMVSSPARLVPRYARCIAILPGHIARAVTQRA